MPESPDQRALDAFNRASANGLSDVESMDTALSRAKEALDA